MEINIKDMLSERMKKENDEIIHRQIFPPAQNGETFISAEYKKKRLVSTINSNSLRSLICTLIPFLNDVFQELDLSYEEGVEMLSYFKMLDHDNAVIEIDTHKDWAINFMSKVDNNEEIRRLKTENEAICKKLKQTEDEMDKLKALTEGKVVRYEKIISQKDDDIRALNKEIKKLEHRLKEMEQKTILPFEEE